MSYVLFLGWIAGGDKSIGQKSHNKCRLYSSTLGRGWNCRVLGEAQTGDFPQLRARRKGGRRIDNPPQIINLPHTALPGRRPVRMDDAPALFLSLVHLGGVPAGGRRPQVPHQGIRQDGGVAARLHFGLGHFVAVE